MSVLGALSLLLGVAQGFADSVPAARLTVIAGTDDTRSIGGALVVIDGARAPAGRTDGAGHWTGAVSAGQRRVRVMTIGYRPVDTVVVVPDEGLVLRLTMAPAIVPLGEVVVTAARREQRLADAVVETELITAADLRQGPADLAAVLADRVGIQLEGGVPAGAGVQLRGFGSRRVLVLLDGQPLVGRVNGNLDLGRLPVSLIERIEIVKGPQSTLYGSDAIGGVVNVITRGGPSSGSRAGLALIGGTQGRAELAADGGWRRGDVATAVEAGAQHLALVPGLASDAATWSRRANAAVRARWDLSDARRLEAGSLAIVERQRYRTGQLFHFGDNVQSAWRVGLHHERGNDRWTATLAGSAFDHLSRASTGAAPASDSGARDRQRLVQGEFQWSGARGPGVVDAGLAVRREWITADRLSSSATGLTGAEPFAQVTLGAGPLLVTPGARISWSDRWGRFVAPRLALLYRPRPEVAIRVSAGRGYRAPDFKELYLEFVNAAAGYAVYGNPALRPEHSTSVSLGAEWALASRYLRASAFNSEYRDFIETGAPDAAGAYTYSNVARGWARGLETEAGTFVGDWRVEGGADWLLTRDLTTGRRLLGRSPFSARATANGPLAGGWTATARGIVTARTPVAADDAGRVTSWRNAYPRLDLRIGRPLPNDLELSAEVANVFDRRLGESWPGYTGRAFTLQLRWQSGGSP